MCEFKQINSCGCVKVKCFPEEKHHSELKSEPEATVEREVAPVVKLEAENNKLEEQPALAKMEPKDEELS